MGSTRNWIRVNSICKARVVKKKNALVAMFHSVYYEKPLRVIGIYEPCGPIPALQFVSLQNDGAATYFKKCKYSPSK